MAERPRAHAPIPIEAYQPRNHAGDCDFQLDQYPHECTCGFTAKAFERAQQPRLDNAR